jgi:hypothetical protein
MNSNESQAQEQLQQPQQQQQVRNYNPFLESVSEKPYSQISVGVTQEQLNNPIPEPTYNANPIETNRDVYGTLGGDNRGGSGGGGGATKSAPINPTLNEVGDAEKKEAATHLAKLIMDGYKGLNKFANQSVQISPRRVRKLVTEGELDLSVQIPYETGATISMGEFIQEFNEQNKDTFSVSKEFEKDVMPVLVRVLQKKGAGLNDEQYLMFAFGKDIAVKAFLGFQIRSALNDVINLGKDFTQAMKEGQVVEPQPQAKQKPQPKPTAQPQQTQMYDETIDPNAHDFNFQTNEATINSTVQPMKVPETGKARVIQQRAKEKVWAENSKKANGSYADVMKERSTGGKRGRKPKTSQLKEEDIVDAIILQETTSKKNEDKIEGLD